MQSECKLNIFLFHETKVWDVQLVHWCLIMPLLVILIPSYFKQRILFGIYDHFNEFCIQSILFWFERSRQHLQLHSNLTKNWLSCWASILAIVFCIDLTLGWNHTVVEESTMGSRRKTRRALRSVAFIIVLKLKSMMRPFAIFLGFEAQTSRYWSTITSSFIASNTTFFSTMGKWKGWCSDGTNAACKPSVVTFGGPTCRCSEGEKCSCLKSRLRPKTNVTIQHAFSCFAVDLFLDKTRAIGRAFPC